MIDIRKLKELVRLMVENDLTELDLKDKEETVAVRRGSSPATIVNHHPAYYGAGGGGAAHPPGAASPPAAPHAAPAAPPAPAPTTPAPPAPAAAPSTAGLTIIKSPMVGTVYLSPNPDSPIFVAAGAKVSEATTVCLIEAMKVFNEIKAECSGTIAQVLVKNGQAVEYGQALFGVKPE